MKRMTKAVGVVLSIIISFSMVIIAPVQAGAAAPTRTVMLYCIGSDLEQVSGYATNTFIGAMEAEYDENVSFIVMTGGTKKWFTTSEYLSGAEKIDPSYNQVWKLEGKRSEEAHGKMTLLKETGIEGYGKTSMVKPATLTAFMDYCYENYPSDSYDLILWDHGGGPAYGFGADGYGDDLSLSETGKAFSESELFQSNKKLDMVIYDCCLMGNTEMIAALGDYADYFICSPEEVPGGGIDHKIWLDAVKAEPSLSGAEIGKLIADDFVDTYDDSEEDGKSAVMAVVDTEKYKAQMLPLLNELSAILLDEATVRGENGLYNFYDEIYSSGAAYEFGSEDYSLFDLESIVSPLSCQQLEKNDAAAELSNRYTVTAEAIFDKIAEGDAVYFGRSDSITSTAENRNLRNKNGVFSRIGDEPAVVHPTGLSVFYPSGDIATTYDYIMAVQETLEGMQDGEAKTFLTRYASAAACYSLITEFGLTVSELAAEGTEEITYDTVTDRLDQEWTYEDYTSPVISFLGEYVFSDSDEAEAYLAEIVAQQANDSVTCDDISVNDGRMTISNASTQALTGLSSAAVIKGAPSCLEFKMLLSRYGYSYMNRDKYFPSGLFFTLSSTTVRRFETEADSFTVELQKFPETVFAVYDNEGSPHIADLRFTNASHTAGYIPLVVLKGYINEENYYLYVSKTEDGWKIDGLSGAIGGSYIPMDSEVFTHERDEIAYTTVSSMTDAVYRKTTLLPISNFCHLDNSTEAWGMTVHELPLSELPEPYACEPYYTLTDIYGSVTDITDIVKHAESTVILGDTDGNGKVDINDATTLQRYLAEYEMTESFKIGAADTNEDGEITIVDVTFIQEWLAQLPSNEKIGA